MNSLIVKNCYDNDKNIFGILNLLFSNNYISEEIYVEKINEVFLIIKERIFIFNNYKSSVISEDKFKSISNSVLFVLGFAFDNNFESTKNLILNNSMSELFAFGEKSILNFINKTKFFYYTIFCKNKLDISNYFYNSTLNDGIKGFFKFYYKFDALNKVITFDYMPFKFKSNSEGVSFVWEYLMCLDIENRFCRDITNEFILSVLSNYKDECINIFEIVLSIKLLQIILGKEQIFNEDIFSLYEVKSFSDRVYEAYYKLIKMYYFKDNIKEYLSKCIGEAINRLVFLSENRRLDVLFNDSFVITYKVNGKLSDEEIDDLIILFNRTHNVSDIIDRTSSLVDLAFLAHSLPLNIDDYLFIFNKLSLNELLTFKYFINNDEIFDVFLKDKSKFFREVFNRNYSVEVVE